MVKRVNPRGVSGESCPPMSRGLFGHDERGRMPLPRGTRCDPGAWCQCRHGWPWAVLVLLLQADGPWKPHLCSTARHPRGCREGGLFCGYFGRVSEGQKTSIRMSRLSLQKSSMEDTTIRSIMFSDSEGNCSTHFFGGVQCSLLSRISFYRLAFGKWSQWSQQWGAIFIRSHLSLACAIMQGSVISYPWKSGRKVPESVAWHAEWYKVLTHSCSASERVSPWTHPNVRSLYWMLVTVASTRVRHNPEGYSFAAAVLYVPSWALPHNGLHGLTARGSTSEAKMRATIAGSPILSALRVVGFTPALPYLHCSMLCSTASGSCMIQSRWQARRQTETLSGSWGARGCSISELLPAKTSSVSKIKEWKSSRVPIKVC